MDYIDISMRSDKILPDIHVITGFKNIKTSVFWPKTGFLVQQHKLLLLPASNLKLSHESLLITQNG